MHQFLKFTPAWKFTCFGQFLCPSSGVYSLYTRHCYMSYRFEDSLQSGVPYWSCSNAVYKLIRRILSAECKLINSWWWAEELSETCRVSCQNKFEKLVHLVGYSTKKFVTMQHGHMNVKFLATISLPPGSRSTGTHQTGRSMSSRTGLSGDENSLSLPREVFIVASIQFDTGCTILNMGRRVTFVPFCIHVCIINISDLYVYVCMYVYVYIYIHTYIHMYI
jgi:hypothetical protein